MKREDRPERLKSLDILRGFDMLWITGGHTLVGALAIATGWPLLEKLEGQMHHVKWEGFQFYDLIFPLFMFIMGVAIPYALLPRMESGWGRSRIYGRILKRFLILALLGVLYNQTWMQDWKDPRIASVLGQIGFAYLFSSLIFVHSRKHWMITAWITGIMIVYALLQNLVPVPGYGPGVLTPEGSLNAWLDQRITPGKLYGGTFDPEGVFNNVSAIAITLMGTLGGLVLRGHSASPGMGIFTGKGISAQYIKVGMLTVAGAACLGMAYALRGAYPIIKSLWTSTFNLHAGGISFLLLAGFYLLFDVWGLHKWGFYFRVIGMNSITIYMGYAIVGFDGISRRIFGGLAIHLGKWGDVIIALSSLAIIWSLLYLLYRKRWFLRI